jgi:hypothetical protein
MHTNSFRQLQALLDQHPMPPTTTANAPMTLSDLKKAIGYDDEKAELRRRTAAKTKPTAPTKPKTPTRAAALAKALTTPRTKPLTADSLLAAAERLHAAGKLDPMTAQRVVTCAHLGRLGEAQDLLKSACKA